MCVCVCVRAYVCVYVRVRMCVCVCMCEYTLDTRMDCRTHGKLIADLKADHSRELRTTKDEHTVGGNSRKYVCVCVCLCVNVCV